MYKLVVGTPVQVYECATGAVNAATIVVVHEQDENGDATVADVTLFKGHASMSHLSKCARHDGGELPTETDVFMALPETEQIAEESSDDPDGE